MSEAANAKGSTPPAPNDPALKDLAAKLGPMFDAAAVTRPDEAATIAPILNLKLPPDDLAREVASLLASKDGRWGLYRWQDEIVTVDEKEGSREIMKPKRFRTWLPTARNVYPIERWQKLEEKDKEGRHLLKAIKGGLTKDQAETLLESDVLYEALPELRGVNPVKMPVIDHDALDARGFPRMRLLQPGYDAASGIYTCKGGVTFREDMDFDEAVNYLHELFRWFGWRDPDRDFAIHLSALVTMFGRGIYLGKAPMHFYNANIQQSGKTTLASYVTWLVHGSMRTRPLLPDAEDKLQETLNTVALRGNPYIFFDNVSWGKTVETVLLDEWLTNAEKEFRKLGGNEEGQVVLRAMTLGTGNNVTLSADLERRTLIADILNRTAGKDRELPDGVKILDAAFFADVENRKKGLAAVWAIVRTWDEDGRPRWPHAVRGSFDQWSLIIPAIVLHAGKKGAGKVWNCLQEPENENIGDKETAEIKKLVAFALDEFGADAAGVMRSKFEITVAQLAGVARRHAVATNKLWPEQDVESVMQTEGKAGGWKYSPPTSGEALDDVEDFDGDRNLSTDEQAKKERSASEWMSPKTRSSFGNEMKARLHELDFKSGTGQLYRLTHLAGVSPARYSAEKVN